MVLALILFIATYLALLIFSKYRVYIALASAAIYVILGILPVGDVLGSVDWNVIMMIAGTMGLTFFFIESKMPSLLADMIIGRIYSVKWIIIVLSLFAGIISAFVDNVATVLMIAPVALTISKKLNISPVNSIIAIAVSSNLQGAATLVGDTTSILLGTYANLDFLDFFVYRGRPGLFWVVEISAIIAAIVLLIVFRNEKQKVQLQDRTLVTDYFPTFILVGTIVLLILASFIQAKPEATNGFICMGMFIISLLRAIIKHKSFIIVKEAFKSIDYFTIGLLAGLFIVIAGITEAGVVDVIAALFVRISGNNIFLMYSLLVWASVLLSAFIDNIPYIATMLPVVTGIASIMNADPTLLYFGLLSGATLGGNLTPIGASANITGLGILRKEGYEVSAGRFMKISVPFTLSAVISGYLLVWLIWSR
jgi:Na+/H+ antiporter NhaD/arsenite permease-like protein